MTSAAQTGGAAAAAVVTLDVYSGRPNPTWTLSRSIASDLMRRIEALSTARSKPQPFDGLGYRGVRVQMQGEGETVTVAASNGGVTVVKGGREVHYADPGSRFELWLVETGAGRVPADVLQFVTGEVAKRAR
jgi:hypothetical protein